LTGAHWPKKIEGWEGCGSDIIPTMHVLPWIQNAVSNPEFWKFTAKDLITAVIALAAFLTAVTNVWVAYIRRHKLRCDLGDSLRIGYGPRPHHLLMFKVDVFVLNQGARPGVITRMAIELSGHQSITNLFWTEVTKTQNIAEKGAPRDVFVDFAGFASPVLVPKYDARLIEAAFWAEHTADLVAGHNYRFKLIYWVAGRKKPYYGIERELKITPDERDFLESQGTKDAKGGSRSRHLHLASSDGREYRAPLSTTYLVQNQLRIASDLLPNQMQVDQPTAADQELP
jgi:hypothetical protein